MAIFFHPSKNITSERYIHSPVYLPRVIEAGSPVLLQDSKQIDFLKIRGIKMDRLTHLDVLFGTVGLIKENKILFLGRFKSSYKWHTGLLTHPERLYFRKESGVIRRQLKGANRLRLPAQVWKKVGEKNQDLKARQTEHMWSLLAQENGQFPSTCWKAPLNSKIVSHFASPRTLPNGRSYHHTGVDLRAPTGTHIYSPSKATVAYADHNVVPGNIVVLDHGGGLFSRYMHLSKISVAIGDQVETGQLLGQAGSTGRVTGPHLHWEVLWKGNHLSPLHFLEVWNEVCNS